MAYYPLPAYNPGNALNFEPLTRAVNAYGQTTRQNALDTYNAGQDAIQNQRQNALLNIQQSQETRAQKQFDQQKVDRMLNHYAGIVQTIEAAPPEQQPDMWKRITPYYQSLRRSDPEFDQEAKMLGFDPNDVQGASRFILGRVRGYQDPMKARETAAEIGLKEAQAQYYADKGASAARGGDAPSGYRWTQDGSLEPIPGGPASGAKRDLKEYQTKDAMFADRLIRSEAALDRVAGIDEKGRPKKGAYNPARSRNAWFPDDWNLVNSSEWQQYQQAAREGIAAILRKDTGAAVTETEWNLYFPMLYPQPGDSPEVIAQKKASRDAASRALKGSSGPAYDVMFPGGSITGPAGAGGPQPGAVEDGYRFKGGNPADPNSWEPVQ